MIPEVDPASGHLPPGRYRATYGEVKERFCDGHAFAESRTRFALWSGLDRYLAAWFVAEQQLGSPVLLAIWMGGSYISATCRLV